MDRGEHQPRHRAAAGPAGAGPRARPDGSAARRGATVLQRHDASTTRAHAYAGHPAGAPRRPRHGRRGGRGAPSRRDAAARRCVLAAGRDAIASEYATGFAITFEVGAPALAAALEAGLEWPDAAVETFLAMLAAPAGHADRAEARARRRAPSRAGRGAGGACASGGIARARAGRALEAVRCRRCATTPTGATPARPPTSRRPRSSSLLLSGIRARMTARAAKERRRAEQLSGAGEQGLPGLRLRAFHHLPRPSVRVAPRAQLPGRRQWSRGGGRRVPVRARLQRAQADRAAAGRRDRPQGAAADAEPQAARTAHEGDMVACGLLREAHVRLPEARLRAAADPELHRRDAGAVPGAAGAEGAA